MPTNPHRSTTQPPTDGANIPGTITANVLTWTGTVMIIQQWAELTEVTTLTNATDVYADIWDGTVATELTAGNPGGAVLSGAPVGSFFTKDMDLTEPYTVHLADQARVSEPDQKEVGRPFFITAKTGVTNYVRFHLTTTDDPVNFVMKVQFTYRNMNGGTLEFV